MAIDMEARLKIETRHIRNVRYLMPKLLYKNLKLDCFWIKTGFPLPIISFQGMNRRKSICAPSSAR